MRDVGAAFLGKNGNGAECERQTMRCSLCSFHWDSAGSFLRDPALLRHTPVTTAAGQPGAQIRSEYAGGKG